MIKTIPFYRSVFLSTLCCLFRFGLMAQEVKNYIWQSVETEACFRNGNEDWNAYLCQNVNAKIPFLYCAPAGTFLVKVLFLIEKNGPPVVIKPLTKVGFGMEEELVRTIKQAPAWMPATQNGKKCRAYKTAGYVFEVKNSSGDML